MNTKLNRSDYILLGLVFLISALLNVWDYYLMDNDLVEYLFDIPLTYILCFIVIWIFMYWLIPNYLLKRTRYFQFFLFGMLILIIAGCIDLTMGYWTSGDDWNKFYNWQTLILNGLFVGADDVGLTFGLLLTKKFYEGQTQIAKIQEEQKENELKILRSQLDPHFLFNNLNTLDALIDSDSEKAKEYVNRLSLLYRYLIQTKDVEVMELHEEMNLVENYMFLIQTRFGTDYDFEVNKNTDYTDKFLPTGAIQALLENVVKHNKANGANTIKTRITIDEDWLTVTNEKSKYKVNVDSLGTGLENLKQRYKFLSEEVPQITNGASEFKISIPIIKLSIE